MKISKIQIGDIVDVCIGASTVSGKIVEDRGPIGVKGRNLYRVLISDGFEEPISVELPISEIIRKK